MTLNEQILSIIQNFQGSDYDQRSALGMARTWIDGNDPKFSPGAEPDEMIAALAKARAVVNKPFRVDSFVGTTKGKPKEVKAGKSTSSEE